MPHSSFLNELLPLSSLSDQKFKVSFLSPFYYDVHLVAIDEAFDVSNYEVMLQLFQKLHFLHAFVSLFSVIHIKNLR